MKETRRYSEQIAKPNCRITALDPTRSSAGPCVWVESKEIPEEVAERIAAWAHGGVPAAHEPAFVSGPGREALKIMVDAGRSMA